MKQFIIAMGLAVLTAGTGMAQTDALLSKKGQPILPEKGDIGLGFNAVPVLSFFGNMFNGNQNNTFAGNNKFVSNLGNQVLFGKYMLSENRALRAHLRIGINGQTNGNYVFDDVANSPDSLVLDRQRLNNQTYVLGAGYEFRRGKGRIQGFYGAEANIALNFGSTSYEYGNAFGAVNPAPTTTTDFANGVSAAQGERLVSTNNGAGFGFGVRPFVGLEYFFAPKISVGAEFGWGLNYQVTGDGESKFESFEAASGNVITRTQVQSGNNGFNVDTDNFNGALFLMFYF